MKGGGSGAGMITSTGKNNETGKTDKHKQAA